MFSWLVQCVTSNPGTFKRARAIHQHAYGESKSSIGKQCRPASLDLKLSFNGCHGLASPSISPTSTIETSLSDPDSPLTTRSSNSDTSGSVDAGHQSPDAPLLQPAVSGDADCPTPTFKAPPATVSTDSPTWGRESADAEDSCPVFVTVSVGDSVTAAKPGHNSSEKQLPNPTPALSHFWIPPTTSINSTCARTASGRGSDASLPRKPAHFWQGTATAVSNRPTSAPPTEEEHSKTGPMKELLLGIMEGAKQLDGILRTVGEACYMVQKRHPDVALLRATTPCDSRLALASSWMQLYPPTSDADAAVQLALAGWTGTGACSATPQPLADMLRAYMPDIWAQLKHLTEGTDADALLRRDRRTAATSYAGLSQRRSVDIDTKLLLPDLAQLLLGNTLLAVQQQLSHLQNQLSDVVSWWNQQFSNLTQQSLLQLSFIIDNATFQLETTHTNVCACRLDVDRVEQTLARRLVHQPARLRAAVSGRASLQLQRIASACAPAYTAAPLARPANSGVWMAK